MNVVEISKSDSGGQAASNAGDDNLSLERLPSSNPFLANADSRSQPAALRDISTMANEKVPPKGANPFISKAGPLADFDDDFDKLHRAFGSIKPSVLKGIDVHGTGSSKGLPSSGHPMKMMSSRKQKADIFIHQTNRPEHHLGGTRVGGPKPLPYQDRKPSPLPVFNSNNPPKQTPSYADQVFYTDPSKASADLKALLEGGMEDDEDEEDQETASKLSSESGLATKERQMDEENKAASLAVKSSVTGRRTPIAKDGIVPGLKVRLLPHQVEGVEWMRGRELGPVKRGKVPKGGLLADDMGLGKTLQSVSLILINRKPEKGSPGWKKHFEEIEGSTLVVAPLALIRQWEHEIADKVETSHGLKVLVHHGPQRTKNFKDMTKYDVVVTTFQILMSEHGSSSEAENGSKVGCFGLRWWRVILDEAHTIKNRNAKSTKACYALRSEYRWCLSGTPLQNNLDELQSLVKFLRISPYDNYQQWKQEIDLPMKNGKGHIAISRLHSLLRCFMKRRTKDILKEEGALNPGGKPAAEGEPSSTGFRHTERKIVTIAAEMLPKERRFYSRLEARADQRLEIMMREKLSYASAFTLLLRLRQTCNHPKLVEGKLERDKDALYTGSSQKSQDLDMNAVADMFAGMGITSKNCSICGKELALDDTTMNQDKCAECHEDLEYFNSQEQPLTKKSKRVSRKRSKKSKDRKMKKPEGGQIQTQRSRPRRRNAVIDSDDEEEADGSWLVPEAERGGLQLGKAGGKEDEDAEGGGDWIGSEDSDEDDQDQDRSNLDSFVVDDETAGKQKGPDEASADDSLLSVDALTQAMASQTLEDRSSKDQTCSAPSKESSSETETSSDESDDDATEAGYGSSDDEDEGEDEDEVWLPGKGSKASPIVASAKIRELSKILEAEARQHKFIVFSQFTSMLDIIEPFLEKDDFNYVRYDGSMRNEDREESLRRLREDENTRILLCSLKCGSLGLNLTAATRVVIVEPFWNPVSRYFLFTNRQLCDPKRDAVGSRLKLTRPSLWRNKPSTACTDSIRRSTSSSTNSRSRTRWKQGSLTCRTESDYWQSRPLKVVPRRGPLN